MSTTVNLAAHARRGLKSTETRLKNTLKMQKDVGMACQKVRKQGRDDIIVR